MKSNNRATAMAGDIHWDIQAVDAWAVKSSEIENDYATYEKFLKENQYRFKVCITYFLRN